MLRLRLSFLMVLALATARLLATDIGTFSGGTGTAADPFIITKPADLAEIQSYLHYGATTYEGCFFRVDSDLVFTDYTGIATGMSNHQFQATFDGNGHKVRGIQAVINNNGTNFGLFGWIGAKCVIKNLTVDSCSITARGNCTNSALLVSHNGGTVENCHVTNATLDYTKANWTNQNGGMVAYNESGGTVRGCTFTGNVTTGCKFGALAGQNNGGTVQDCISYADICITRSNAYVGGISASAIRTTSGADRQFVNCEFRGNIHILSASVTGNYVGGICADNSNIVFSGCSNSGTIMALNYTGGIAGYIWGDSRIEDCRNSGTVTDIFMAHDSIPASFGMGDYLGGICGYAKEGRIERCFNVGAVRSLRAAGGLCGQAEGITFTDCYNAGLIDAPHTWLSGNDIKQQCGGLVGYKCGANSFNLTFVRCLSLGTVNAAVAARPKDCVYVGQPAYELDPVYTDCHYDSRVAGWGDADTGALSTETLTSGTPLAGFATDVWTFAAGYYPRLKAQATTDAALAGAAPIFLSADNNHGRVTAPFTVGTADASAQWSIRGNGVTLGGNQVTVTRGDLPEAFTLTSTVGTATRANLLSVYPQLFAQAGTEADPYIIATYADFRKFAAASTTGGVTFSGEHIRLGADIDMESDATFPCIGMQMSAPFLGTFDGAGHSLRNWKLTNHTDKVQYGGLFGYIGQTGKVSDLVIDKSCSVGVYMNGGVVVGRLYGTVSDVRVLPASILSAAAAGSFGGIAGRVEKTGAITDCYVGSGIALTGASNRVGGIACNSSGTIAGCQYAGTLTGTAAYRLAGIVAENSGLVDECLASGAVNAQYGVGGIVAANLSGGLVRNCLVTAPIQYTQKVDQAGAVVGENSGSIIGTVYDSQISLLDNLSDPGIIARTTREIVGMTPGLSSPGRWLVNDTVYPRLRKFAAEDAAMLTSFPVFFPEGTTRITMVEGKPATCHTATGLTLRLEDRDDFTVTAAGRLSFDGYTSYCYDYLKQTYAGITRQMRVAAYGDFLAGSGTEADPYLIAKEADLKKLSTQSALGANQGDYAGMHFKVTADIDMTAAISGISCGNTKRFNGIIHGEGHTISNLTITGTAECTGLVGYLGPQGRVENLHIASGTVKSSAQYTGALVGLAKGVAENCSNGAEVNCTAAYTGGLVGYALNSPRLTNLSNTGAVTSTKENTGGVAGYILGRGKYSGLSNRGDVKGVMYVGGIAGRVLAGKISDLTNYGSVGAATTATCNMHGGIFGSANACDTIARARNYGRIAGGSTGIGGVIGRYWPEADKTRHLLVADCLNADSVTGKLQNVGGIVGMGETYPLTIERCANTGAITCSATSVAAGTPAAGGIMGGGIPTIADCYNAGVVRGLNCLGGILGRVPNNTAVATLRNCLNTGWLEGYSATAANIGSISGYFNTGSTYIDCRYDSCLSNVGAVMKLDRDSAVALKTTEIAPTGCYPVPETLKGDSVLTLWSLPVVYKGDNTRYNVTRSLYVRQLPTPEVVTWTVPDELSLADTVVRVKGQVLKGEYSIRATYGSLERVIPMTYNFDSTTGVEGVADDGMNIAAIPGGLLLPEGEYAVYTLSGQCVARGTSCGGQPLTGLPPGVYVVVVGGKTAKVLVR